MQDRPNRKKATFDWNTEDVLKIIASGLKKGTPYKSIYFPQPNYPSSSADMIMQLDNKMGKSMFNSYNYNERYVFRLGAG